MEAPQEMIDAVDEVQEEVLEYLGVTGIGVGLREWEGEEVEEPAVCIYIEEGASVPEGLPEELGGAPVRFVALSPIPLDDRKRYDQMKGGIAISRVGLGAGTFGAVVKDTENEEGEPTPYGLTAGHVVYGGGDDWRNCAYQLDAPLPTSSDGEPYLSNRVGTIVLTEMPEPDPLVGGAIVGDVDAAVFELDLAAAYKRDRSPVIVDHSGTGEMVAAITNTEQPTLCWKVRKRGMATGYTEGTVRGVHCTFEWWKPGLKPTESPYTYLAEQFLISSDSGGPFCQEGDSGSLIVEKDAPTAVGLLWGGHVFGQFGLASKIWKVEERLGVTTIL